MSDTNQPKIDATHAAIPVEQFNEMIAFIKQVVPTGYGEPLLKCLNGAVPIMINTPPGPPPQPVAQPPADGSMAEFEAAKAVTAAELPAAPAAVAVNGHAAR